MSLDPEVRRRIVDELADAQPFTDRAKQSGFFYVDDVADLLAAYDAVVGERDALAKLTLDKLRDFLRTLDGKGVEGKQEVSLSQGRGDVVAVQGTTALDAASTPVYGEPDEGWPDDHATRFTLVFDGDLRAVKGNPFHIMTPYGYPVASALGDALLLCSLLEEALDGREAVVPRDVTTPDAPLGCAPPPPIPTSPDTPVSSGKEGA